MVADADSALTSIPILYEVHPIQEQANVSSSENVGVRTGAHFLRGRRQLFYCAELYRMTRGYKAKKKAYPYE